MLVHNSSGIIFCTFVLFWTTIMLRKPAIYFRDKLWLITINFVLNFIGKELPWPTIMLKSCFKQPMLTISAMVRALIISLKVLNTMICAKKTILILDNCDKPRNFIFSKNSLAFWMQLIVFSNYNKEVLD